MKQAVNQGMELKRYQRRLYKIGEILQKQMQAALFGIMILGTIMITQFYYPANAWISRSDFIALFVVGTQLMLLVFRFETLQEARIILIFHIVGTIMELFKTSAGSWQYQQGGYLFIKEVPLYTGFMYAAVGSYIMKVNQLYDLRFKAYPHQRLTFLIGALIYLNFFTHHYIWDFRWLILAVICLIYARTVVYIKISQQYYRLPILAGFVAVASLIWIAENIGTIGGAWFYPNQMHAWHFVSPQKIISWFLLLLISVALVTWLYPPKKVPQQLLRTSP